ncbi:FAD-dependent oxidoreductase [Prescottella agglutinans]|uniref:NADPH-dependent 2,4-dienoyl-CoA reductase/sulfur reductase-like enzyme/ferredoxin n=1 Tax=Prescottella agglutinans TaxID=1644129 RepID=A0ABT6MBV9_9NOCA|nr:FAD-dependent oxidoreductase [Prescottella agglutinans]MDH6281794.1 NADPH-dependent 2,4-dienoyl-CoA reductase/sulfur reductase-like enzyme/ferredoxin [Prescottella agglutinans]
MRVVVDLTRCQGYAQCAFLAPDVFEIRGDEALLYDPEPDDGQRLNVRRAAAACPVQALQVDGPGGDWSPDVPATSSAPPDSAAVDEFRRHGRIVVVGCSLAGLRAAEALRGGGFTGSLTMIGDETCEPYDRPPLSKQVLTGMVPADRTTLPRRGDLDAEWRLGVAATGLDLAGRAVELANGERVPFDKVLISTGVRARPWPVPEQAALDGVCVLHNRDDAADLRRRLESRPDRVLVIGAGFTGTEVASACRELGVPVTVVASGPAPLSGALGAVIGDVAAGIQREHGVDLRCGLTVDALEGDDSGRLRTARLSNGDVVDADVAVVAMGGIRNVEWLAGTALASARWGIACDAGCRAFDENGLVTDHVFVAGDVARTPHPLFGYQFLALEHWSSAVAEAEIVAHNMISGETDRWPNLHVPAFWSIQFDHDIRSVGVPPIADEVMVVDGSVAERRFVAAYGYKGRLVAAVAFDAAKWLDFYREAIEAAAAFPPSRRATATGDPAVPVPPGFPPPQFPVRDATVVVTGHDPSARRARLIRR